ncbi:MAG: hypothetical protein GY850_35070 [bacterium]|nr:hypothetical protein [bacterium]
MILAEPIQVTQIIANVFDRLQIPYLVGGSLASSLHGIPRATQDVDMVVDLKSQHVTLLVKALEAAFYIDADMIDEAIQHGSSFNVIHLDTMFKIDIFVLQDDPASREEMKRRELYKVSEEFEPGLFLATAEDIILRKLYWFHLGGGSSERQWNDVLGVLQVQKEKLDYSYLQRSAHQMGISSLLKKAIKDASEAES